MPDACASGCRAGFRLARLLFCDCTDRNPVEAVEVVPADTAGIEVDAPRVVRVVRIEGRGPVEAEGPGIVKVRVFPACGGKEDGLPVGPRDESSFYSVLGSPCPGAVGP